MAKKKPPNTPPATALAKLIQEAAYGHSLHGVFRDFCEMAAISISNAIDLLHREEREKNYLRVVGRYKKETVGLFPSMLGELVKALEEEPRDVLGKLFHELDLQNEWAGQFFTPYDGDRMHVMANYVYWRGYVDMGPYVETEAVYREMIEQIANGTAVAGEVFASRRELDKSGIAAAGATPDLVSILTPTETPILAALDKNYPAPWGSRQEGDAERQGWGIFDTRGAAGHDDYELCLITEMGIFEADSEAWRFVMGRADLGDWLAVQALDFLAKHAPLEHGRVTSVGFMSIQDMNAALKRAKDRIVDADFEEVGPLTADQVDEALKRMMTEGSLGAYGVVAAVATDGVAETHDFAKETKARADGTFIPPATPTGGKPYVIGSDRHGTHITHLLCGKTSYHDDDVRRLYCGACREFLEVKP